MRITQRPSPARSIALACAWAIIACSFALPAQAGAAESRTISLLPGRSETLTFPTDIGTALVVDPETADVEVLDARSLLVLGYAPGATRLQVFDAGNSLLGTYHVEVRTQQSEDAQAVVSRIVGEQTNIRVDSIGDTLFVAGEAKSPSQAELVMRAVRSVAGDTQVVDAVSLDSPVQVNLEAVISEVSRNVTRELGIDWSLDINPFAHPLRTLVSGVRMGTGALQIADIYSQNLSFAPLLPRDLPEGIGNLVEEATAGTAQAELQTQEPGVVRGSRGGDGGIVLAHYKDIHGAKYRASAFLEALAENGLAVVLARPNITAVSGQPAEFFSGVEIPVPTVAEGGAVGTEYRQTGVSLTFTPTVLDNDQISLTVQPRIREVSAGGANIFGAFVPNINERSAATTVELGDGESIAIAGLYRRSSGSSSTGIPLLKDIPVWGGLFRTTRDTDRSVELIIVVTPRIVAAVGAQDTAALGGAAGALADSARQLGNEFYY